MTTAATLLMASLLCKHFLFDFVFQTPYQLANKGRYGHPGGLLHAGFHAAATFTILLAFAPGWPFASLAAAAEFVAHYHIDWAKEVLVKRFAAGRGTAFWRVIGFDQLLHSLTYVAIVFVLGALGVAG